MGLGTMGQGSPVTHQHLSVKPRQPDISEALGSLVRTLTEVKDNSLFVNQYAFGVARGKGFYSDVCRSNLIRYLAQMSLHQPRILLVGEAAGYRGCRLTGIPFTSERIIVNDKAANRSGIGCVFFGLESGYRVACSERRPIGEATATIVWAGIRQLESLPLLWNVFPFHPHQAGKSESNRRPSTSELALGLQFMPPLLDLFHSPRLLAVGRVAENALATIGLKAQYIRHPSHGGKQEFLKTLASFGRA